MVGIRQFKIAVLVMSMSLFSCGGAKSQTDLSGLDDASDESPVGDVAMPDASDAALDSVDDGDALVEDVGHEDVTGDVDPMPIDLLAWGPYAVGYRLFETTDAARSDRPVPIAVYYPAQGTAAAADTVTECSFDASFLPNAVSVDGAVAVPVDGGYPVVVFSHGSGASKEMYKYLLEFLASHGFVCVAPDHAGNVGIGSIMPEDMEMTSLRVTDLLWTIAWLGSAVNDEDGPLNGLADMDRLAIAGHSYGGHTVMALGGAAWDWDHIAEQCALESPPDPYVCSLQNHRDEWTASLPSSAVKAVISLAHDASEVHFGMNCAGAASVGVPIMYMGGTYDQMAVFETNAQLCHDNGSTPSCLVKLEDAGHMEFTDAMAEGTMACDRVHHLVRGLALAFLEKYLNDMDSMSAALSADLSVWADVSDFQSVCR